MSRTVYYDHSGNEVEPPKADAVKPTNADRIRTMSDEELAEWFVVISTRQIVHLGFRDATAEEKAEAIKCWLDWLQEVAEEGKA